MNAAVSSAVLATFLIFCRIGGCLMLMPGISSPRVPVQVRLFTCVGVTLALTPILLAHVQSAFADVAPINILHLVISETAIGAMIGVMGRCFFVALETMAVAIATSVGLSNAFGVSIDENESVPEMATLITTAATVLLFVTDQHWEILRGLVASYDALPVAQGFRTRFALSQLSDTTSVAFAVALRVSSPFMIFSIIVNAAIGLINKLTPQISVFFISAPFTVAGGLFLFYFICKQFLDLFMAAFSSWLAAG